MVVNRIAALKLLKYIECQGWTDNPSPPDDEWSNTKGNFAIVRRPRRVSTWLNQWGLRGEIDDGGGVLLLVLTNSGDSSGISPPHFAE